MAEGVGGQEDHVAHQQAELVVQAVNTAQRDSHLLPAAIAQQVGMERVGGVTGQGEGVVHGRLLRRGQASGIRCQLRQAFFNCTTLRTGCLAVCGRHGGQKSLVSTSRTMFRKVQRLSGRRGSAWGCQAPAAFISM